MRRREEVYLACLLWATLLLLPAHAARAAEADLDSKAGALDRRVTTREERSAIFTKFGVPNTALYGALAPGQALVLFSLCGSDTACQTRALNDRNAHMGWSKVAEDLKRNGFTTTDKVGEAIRRVTDAHRDLIAKNEPDKAEPLGRKLEKVEKTEKVEKVEKMDKPERIERAERPERPERPGR